MKQPIYDAVDKVSKKGKDNYGILTSTETANSHRKIRYNNSTTSTIAWKQDTLLLYFASEIQKKSCKKILIKHILSASTVS